MTGSGGKRKELTLNVRLIPSLSTATKDWYQARHRFQDFPGQETLNAYNASTDVLQLAWENGHRREPDARKAFEAFRRKLIETEDELG